MISKEELNQFAEAKNLSVQNAEKDYILEVLLFCIAKRAAERLVFKGGTALYKVYGLNRFSEDLDFTLNYGKIDKKFFELVLRDAELLGLKGKLKALNEYKNEINAHLTFFGPLYNGGKETLCFVAINISLREKTLDSDIKFLIPNYRDVPAFSVAVMQAKEMLAEKIRAILTRDKARDVYDLWFLFKLGVVFDEKLVNGKLKIYRLKYDKNTLIHRISDLKKGWEMDLQNLIIGDFPEFEDVVLLIKSYL